MLTRLLPAVILIAESFVVSAAAENSSPQETAEAILAAAQLKGGLVSPPVRRLVRASAN